MSVQGFPPISPPPLATSAPETATSAEQYSSAITDLAQQRQSMISDRSTPGSGLAFSAQSVRDASMRLADIGGREAATALRSAMIPRFDSSGASKTSLPFQIDSSKRHTNSPCHRNRLLYPPVLGSVFMDPPALYELVITRRKTDSNRTVTASMKANYDKIERTRRWSTDASFMAHPIDGREGYNPQAWNLAQRAEFLSSMDGLIKSNNGTLKEDQLLDYFYERTPLKVWNDYTLEGVLSTAHTINLNSVGIRGSYASATAGGPSTHQRPLPMMTTLISENEVQTKAYTLGRGTAPGAALYAIIKPHQLDVSSLDRDAENRILYPTTLTPIGQTRIDANSVKLKPNPPFPFAPMQMFIIAMPDGGVPDASFKSYSITYDKKTHTFHDGLIIPFGKVYFNAKTVASRNRTAEIEFPNPLTIEPVPDVQTIQTSTNGDYMTIIFKQCKQFY